MNIFASNLSSGDLLGNYRIESIISYEIEEICYLAEDMRKSVKVLIWQYSKMNNLECSLEKIIDFYRKNSHPNIAKYQEILSENGFFYIVMQKPLGKTLENYLELNPILNEIEINNLLSTLLSIFIFLAKQDLIFERILFQHIYREDTGMYTICGVLPREKPADYNDHYIAMLNNVIEKILVLENEVGIHFSESFRALIGRVSAQQFKTIEELAPLFKISGHQKVNYECEPIVCHEKTNYEKYLYLAFFMSIVFFTANLLNKNEDAGKEKTMLSVEPSKVSRVISSQTVEPIIIPSPISNKPVNEKNQSNNIVHIENENIQSTINVESENLKNVTEYKPITTDKYVDYGEYIKDKKTGLLWQKDGTASGKLNFYQADEYAKRLKLGNLYGWRVPTIKELETIFPALDKPFINTPYTDQKCCKGPYEWHSYWTAEMDKSLPDYAFVYHWYQFGGANNCYASKNYDYVRCVHDPL